MNRALTKAERLLQIEALLLAHPEGLSQAEIARRLGVNRSTIHRYLPDLDRFCVYETNDGRLAIDRDHYLTNVRFTLHEAMAVHLAARLMATRSDKQNPHAASALRKLGLALDRLAPRLSDHLQRSANDMDDAAQRHDPVYLEILETLTRSWSLGRKVHLWHRHEGTGRVFEYDFAPYFIEPYAVGHTTHAIGWRDPPDAIRTLKLERIRRIELLDEAFEVPPDFNPRDLLDDAWGIWYADDEPVEVVLSFHPRVAGRVRETQWHRSESVEELVDGNLIWRAQVAEPREMLPWIRGWGADVQVLAPPDLKQRMVGEARRLADVYGIKPIPVYQRLWAKTNRERTQVHPLVCHLIDVAQVALRLWNESLTDGARTQIARALNLQCEAAGRLVAFWAGLHDLGKATPCFQRKYLPAEIELSKVGLTFPRIFGQQTCPHGTISARLLRDLLESKTGLPRRVAISVCQAVGGHHGCWPAPADIQALKHVQIGGDEWEAVRGDLVDALASVLRPPQIERVQGARDVQNALWTLLSGLTAVADWIGSMQRYFPYQNGPVETASYAQAAASRAGRALAELQWTEWRPPEEDLPFTELFPFSPNVVQRAVIELAEQLDEPSLVIIEAPTGSGKTEAALYLADRWAVRLRQRGLYVAMPTMATSNQMYGRVCEFMDCRYRGSAVTPLLIHSQARWKRDASPRVVIDDERPASSIEAMTWFLQRKRSLLAPLGVGTVDQTFLSVLQTRHFFVRLFGLSHKTLIFDEVHAYDTYMSSLFERLLRWLRAVGTSVVLLSATLPAKSRRALLEAYAGSAKIAGAEVRYPALTWVSGSRSGIVALDMPESKAIGLGWLGREPAETIARLAELLRDGGCAAVICNTVARAQEVFRALREARIVPEGELILFHARYPFAWRDEIEKNVLARFGKGSDRPGEAIVVATQVIEQSLDLDFDVMVSDLAPVDLLLQRAGRLHRHERSSRPLHVAAPQFFVTVDAVEDAVPDFGSDAFVYEPFILLRSYLALRGRDRLVLPADTAALIEAVYGDEGAGEEALPQSIVAALFKWRKMMEAHEEHDVFEARKRLVAGPDDEGLLYHHSPNLEEDSAALHQAFQALTRLGPRSLSLVCLHQTPQGLNTQPDGTGVRVDPGQVPDDEMTDALARHTVAVSHWSVVQHFLAQETALGWEEHPLLRNHRLARFRDGVCLLDGVPYQLRLSRELGLEIVKEA